MAVAEFEHAAVTFTDGQGGICRFVAICESTQTEVMPEGGTAPIVVAIRLENSTGRAGRGQWRTASGATETGPVLPGENRQHNVAPPRRVGLHRLRFHLSWGAS